MDKITKKTTLLNSNLISPIQKSHLTKEIKNLETELRILTSQN